MNDRELALERALMKGAPGLNVFIIDDSELSRMKIERMVVSFGWKVAETAVDGVDAVEKFRKIWKTIDLVTLDVQMPHMNGLECLQELLKIDPKARIVMVTVDSQLDTVKEAVMKGARHYIVKPFERMKVMQTFMNVMNK